MFKKLTWLGRLGLYLLAFSLGVTAGTYFHDWYGQPDTENNTEVNIKKQKVTGDGNDVEYKNDVTINQKENEKGISKKEQRAIRKEKRKAGE